MRGAGLVCALIASSPTFCRFVDICTAGGMEAVAKDPHFENLFERNPANKQRLLDTDAVRAAASSSSSPSFFPPQL